MRHFALIALVTFGAAALSGCGQKGPLTLPTRPGSSAPAGANGGAAPPGTAATPAAAASVTGTPSSGN